MTRNYEAENLLAEAILKLKVQWNFTIFLCLEFLGEREFFRLRYHVKY